MKFLRSEQPLKYYLEIMNKEQNFDLLRELQEKIIRTMTNF